MKIAKRSIVIIILPFLVILWYQWSYPDKWEHVRYPLEYKESIIEASNKYSLDPYLVAAIIYEESRFKPSSKSKAGALGLMQIMPDTGKWVAEKQGRKFGVDDLYSPSVNIDMGCWYFNYLRDKYKNEKLALAAYNSGDKNVDRWLAREDYDTIDEMVANIPYGETRNFVQKVMNTRAMYEKLYPGEFRGVGTP